MKTIKIIGSGPCAGLVSYAEVEAVTEFTVYATLEEPVLIGSRRRRGVEFRIEDGAMWAGIDCGSDILRIDAKDLTSVLGWVG